MFLTLQFKIPPCSSGLLVYLLVVILGILYLGFISCQCILLSKGTIMLLLSVANVHLYMYLIIIINIIIIFILEELKFQCFLFLSSTKVRSSEQKIFLAEICFYCFINRSISLLIVVSLSQCASCWKPRIQRYLCLFP